MTFFLGDVCSSVRSFNDDFVSIRVNVLCQPLLIVFVCLVSSSFWGLATHRASQSSLDEKQNATRELRKERRTRRTNRVRVRQVCLKQFPALYAGGLHKACSSTPATLMFRGRSGPWFLGRRVVVVVGGSIHSVGRDKVC